MALFVCYIYIYIKPNYITSSLHHFENCWGYKIDSFEDVCRTSRHNNFESDFSSNIS